MVVRTADLPSASVVAATEARPGGSCPICARQAAPLDEFVFAAKPHLPTVIRLEFCGGCNFIFAGDLDASAYASHYASVLNDGDHVVATDFPDSDHRLQAGQIESVLPDDFAGDVLDFGCGQGRLLHALFHRFPRASLFGHDVVDYLRKPHDICFVADLADLSQRFDLIIVSHVVEHLVDFDILDRVTRLLRPGGLLYVEAPDPFAYIECDRREFMYYFDRLHINHFSGTAIRALLSKSGLSEIRRGTHRFRYRDGHYPAAYSIATRIGDEHRARSAEPSLDAVYRRYRDHERVRANETRRRIRQSVGSGRLLVYGGGDNFHRARWPGGPLDGIDLLAVIDRRADDLPSGHGFRFERPDVASSRYPTGPVAVTVSEGSEAIAAMLRRSCPDRPVFFV